MSHELVREKIVQAIEILREKGIDAWLIFVRETAAMADPTLEMILGASCTWESVFLITASGRTAAIVGNLDKANIESTGDYQQVIGFTASIREELRGLMTEHDPQTIALNYSTDDYMADGLTHGMFMLLKKYLRGTPYAKRFVPSEEIVATLRGRKSETELARIRQAVRITEEIYARASQFLRVGQSEKEIAEFIKSEMRKENVTPAWDETMCPSVFTGPETAGAHYGPTERLTQPGHVLNMDFGVKKNDYCSDLQRTWYFLRQGEIDAPDVVYRGFYAVRDAIHKAAAALRPGVEGWQIDKIARDHIVQQGFDEYPHALGHQVGRLAHDGGGLLGPIWDRYKKLPFKKVELGQVYTIEPRVTVEGHGVATIEEMVVVRENGVEFLSTPQQKLYLVK